MTEFDDFEIPPLQLKGLRQSGGANPFTGIPLEESPEHTYAAKDIIVYDEDGNAVKVRAMVLDLGGEEIASNLDYTIYGTNFTATIPPAEMLEGYDPSPDGAADTEWSAGFEIVDGAMTGEVIYSADVDRFPVDDDGEQLFYLLPLIRNEKTVSTGGCYQEDITCVNGEAMQQLYKIG